MITVPSLQNSRHIPRCQVPAWQGSPTHMLLYLLRRVPSLTWYYCHFCGFETTILGRPLGDNSGDGPNAWRRNSEIRWQGGAMADWSACIRAAHYSRRQRQARQRYPIMRAGPKLVASRRISHAASPGGGVGSSFRRFCWGRIDAPLSFSRARVLSSRGEVSVVPLL